MGVLLHHGLDLEVKLTSLVIVHFTSGLIHQISHMLIAVAREVAEIAIRRNAEGDFLVRV